MEETDSNEVVNGDTSEAIEVSDDNSKDDEVSDDHSSEDEDDSYERESHDTEEILYDNFDKDNLIDVIDGFLPWLRTCDCKECTDSIGNSRNSKLPCWFLSDKITGHILDAVFESKSNDKLEHKIWRTFHSYVKEKLNGLNHIDHEKFLEDLPPEEKGALFQDNSTGNQKRLMELAHLVLVWMWKLDPVTCSVIMYL